MHTKFLIAVAVLGTLWLLAPAAAHAQKDEKDALIELQKLVIKRQAGEIDFQKAMMNLLAEEIALQNQAIRDREATIVKLEAEIKRTRVAAVELEALMKATQFKAEKLLEQLRAKGADKKSPVQAEPNPPAVKVHGKIEKLDGDLLQISLGTDHGVNKNNTLEVYRLMPEPKYLGMIRIVEANLHHSVARRIPAGNAELRPMLKVGDLVTGKLLDDGAKKDKSGPTKEKDETNKK